VEEDTPAPLAADRGAGRGQGPGGGELGEPTGPDRAPALAATATGRGQEGPTMEGGIGQGRDGTNTDQFVQLQCKNFFKNWNMKYLQ